MMVPCTRRLRDQLRILLGQLNRDWAPMTSVKRIASSYLLRSASEQVARGELPEHVSDVVDLVEADGGRFRSAWDSIHGWSTDVKGPASLDPLTLATIVNSSSFRWISVDLFTGRELFPSNPDSGAPLLGYLTGGTWRVDKKDIVPFVREHRGKSLPFRELGIGQKV